MAGTRHGQLPLARPVLGRAELGGGVGVELLELVRGGAPGRLETGRIPCAGSPAHLPSASIKVAAS